MLCCKPQLPRLHVLASFAKSANFNEPVVIHCCSNKTFHISSGYFMFSHILQKDQEYEASIFTGEEEIFAFERTVSRLREMQGEEYWSMDRKIPRPNIQRT